MTLTGGSWDANRPLNNAKDWTEIHQRARSSDATKASTQWIATFDRPRPVKMRGFCNHNFSVQAKVRERYYYDAARTILLYDSGWQYVWDAYITDREWEDNNYWECTPEQEEIEGYQWHDIDVLDQIYMAEAIHVEVDDEDNPDGYVQLGLYEVSNAWQPSANFDYDAKLGFQFRSITQESDGGSPYTRRRDKPRVWNGQIKYLAEEEARAKAWEHQRETDLDRPFLFIPDPNAPTQFVREAGLYRNADPGLQGYAHTGKRSVPFSFVELI